MITGWNTDKISGPYYTHDCEACKYLFTVNFYTGTDIKYVDIYKQCTKNKRRNKYLFRYSSEGPNYTSGISLEQLLVYGAIRFIE